MLSQRFNPHSLLIQQNRSTESVNRNKTLRGQEILCHRKRRPITPIHRNLKQKKIGNFSAVN